MSKTICRMPQCSRMISRRHLMAVFVLTVVAVFMTALHMISSQTLLIRPAVTVHVASTDIGCMTCITPYPRQETCDNCFPHDFNYMINNEDLCKTTAGSPRVEILILVTSSAHEKDRRDAVRSSWGSVATHSSSTRLAFLLGKHPNDSVNALLLEENRLHSDLIQEDFQDSYMNLTLKSVMGLKWALNYCKDTTYIMKTDSDMFINIDNLRDALEESPLVNEIGGIAKPPESPIRDPGSKWHTPKSFYPNRTFPWTFSGTGYVMKYEVAKDVVAMSRNTPYFHLEDIYIAFNIHKLGYGVRHLNGFSADRIFLDPRYYCACVTSSHQLPPNDLKQIWSKMKEMNCSAVRKSLKTGNQCTNMYIKHILWIIFKYGAIAILIINVPLYMILTYLGRQGKFINSYHKALYSMSNYQDPSDPPKDFNEFMQKISGSGHINQK